ncbi:MAG: DUF924 domain-containing protein [Polyangiaceae bacterium]|nr:DUF924 domain-containing protein [Polyangiaceae bacterium]
MIGPDDVLEFWFGELAPDGSVSDGVSARWWKKDEAFDRTIEQRFGESLERAGGGQLDDWAESAAGTVALIVLLDQFSRNVYRNSPGAFANDARALALTTRLLDSGAHLELPAAHAYFALMPLMHSESLADQERGVALFSALAERATSSTVRGMFQNAADFAERHRVIVARFGRFPHRNAILGRPSSAEEEDFLKQPGSSF